jgi:hypothetical protein
MLICCVWEFVEIQDERSGFGNYVFFPLNFQGFFLALNCTKMFTNCGASISYSIE